MYDSGHKDLKKVKIRYSMYIFFKYLGENDKNFRKIICEHKTTLFLCNEMSKNQLIQVVANIDRQLFYVLDFP